MDQHLKVHASDGWRQVISYRKAKTSQLQDKLDELHKTMARLSVMLPEYQKLIECAHGNI